MTPIVAFERLFFAVFGQTTSDDINPQPQNRPDWTEGLFKLIFGTYLLVSVVVLINLLIAMMSDTYQRIQVTTPMPLPTFTDHRFSPSIPPPVSVCVCVCRPVLCVVHFFFSLLCVSVRMNPIVSFELLFFAVFGQTTTDQTQVDKIPPILPRTQPEETDYLFKIVFGIYMLVSVVVLINLLIAMMSDTYQRIQVFRTKPPTLIYKIP